MKYLGIMPIYPWLHSGCPPPSPGKSFPLNVTFSLKYLNEKTSETALLPCP